MIEIERLSKRYGSNQALQDLSLRLPRGQITGIVGHNGAGKSTLIRLLAGEDHADDGAIRLDGHPWSPERGARVGIVHQDPKLFGNMTVGENLLVGREGTRLSRPAAGEAERNVLRRLDLVDVLDERVKSLSLAVQQRVEIARALAWDSDIFLFDEPNSALTVAESEYLFVRMRALADSGKVVILVSHRLDEVADNCDGIALLRNGRLRNEVRSKITATALTELLLEGGGTTVAALETARPTGTDGLSISDWNSEQFDIDAMHFPSGEVTVLLGVEGSGARQVLASISGAVAASGLATLGGKRGGPAIASADAIYLLGDRRSTAFGHLSVADNLMLRRRLFSVPSWFGMVRRARLTADAVALQREHNIVCRSVKDPAASLSGGNQQKMVVASALAASPRILAIEEPTRGVDVGSRREIHAQLRKFAGSGHVVIGFCAEETEAFELADSVRIIDRGAAVCEMRPDQFADAEKFAVAVGAAIAQSRRSHAGAPEIGVEGGEIS
ncbi:MAG: ATP-binding cassette domain-containing protein [Devosia sp.]